MVSSQAGCLRQSPFVAQSSYDIIIQDYSGKRAEPEEVLLPGIPAAPDCPYSSDDARNGGMLDPFSGELDAGRPQPHHADRLSPRLKMR
jgi:hypothetical protein